jgi:hypothetical protein
MKKLITFTFVILIGSNLSFGIGFPHGYAKRKKVDQTENSKRDYIKSHKKILALANAAYFLFLKIDNTISNKGK